MTASGSSPLPVSPTIDQALKAIASFEQSSTVGVWPLLNKKTLAAELRQRVQNPYSVNQGQQPFCGPTAILFELVRKQPGHYVDLCRMLFEQGIVQGKTKRIETLAALRQARQPIKMGEVDWMVLSALRDAESLIFPVDPDAPSVIRNISGMSFSWEMKGWVQEILGYPQIIHTKTYKKGDLLALRDAANSVKLGGVAFPLITAQALLSSASSTELPIPLPNHWVALLGNLQIQNGRVAFDVYSWGKKMRVDVTEGVFKKSFWGVVIGMP